MGFSGKFEKIRFLIEKTVGNGLVLALMSAITIMIVIGYLGYSSYKVHLRLLNGTQIEATLSDTYTKVTRGNTVQVEVKYFFSVNGTSYSGEARLPNYPNSRRLQIIYDPLNPENNKTIGAKDNFERSQTFWLLGLVLCFAVIFVCIGLIFTRIIGNLQSSHKANSKQDNQYNNFRSRKVNEPLKITSKEISWIENEILNLNRDIYGDDRPGQNLDFLQTFPTILLSNDTISTLEIERAAQDLVNQTSRRLNQEGGLRWDVPFRRPKVEFSVQLPRTEPGHIEFGNDSTIIRIHPKYRDEPFLLAAILCHELAHFILDHNGFNRPDLLENEKLTDLFVFKCGQGLIYLQGVVDFIEINGQLEKNKLGYMSLEEMAYSHVRCASQFGLIESSIAPSHFRGLSFNILSSALNFLAQKVQGSRIISEIVLCGNNHILRILPTKKNSVVKCPKCGWSSEVWLRKVDQLKALIDEANQLFGEELYSEALQQFRKAETISKRHSAAYCGAAKCLKKQGQHQAAIRELKKFLEICPNDESAIEEMKKLIY